MRETRGKWERREDEKEGKKENSILLIHLL